MQGPIEQFPHNVQAYHKQNGVRRWYTIDMLRNHSMAYRITVDQTMDPSGQPTGAPHIDMNLQRVRDPLQLEVAIHLAVLVLDEWEAQGYPGKS